MKVAVTGKGGAGKTTVAAVLSRALSRAGERVIALDADPNPNLGIALGLGEARTAALDSAVNAFLRKRAAEPHHHGRAPSAPEGSEELVSEIQALAPDGVRLVQAGRIERPAEGCLCCGSHIAGRRIFGAVNTQDCILVADLEPGVNDLIWTEPRPHDIVVVVTEPYRKSLEVAARAVQVARDLSVERIVVVANRVRGDDDLTDVGAAVPDAEVVGVPNDPAVARASALGLAAVDLDPRAPAVLAIEALARRLWASYERRPDAPAPPPLTIPSSTSSAATLSGS